MSELQISLLGIGIAVVLAMYIYSAWQHRQYRRKFGAAFKPEREDALYQSSPENSATEDADTEVPIDELLAETAAKPLTEMAERVPSGEALPGEPQPRESQRVHAVDGVCMLLDAATDYIAVLSLKSPASAHALDPLWQQRFDFGKNVHACGLNIASGAWEKVIAESPLSYSAFKLSLQLADRSGAVSEGRLADFRELARNIARQLGAEAELPDVAAAGTRAQELDGFCAEVDQMIGLNILPSGERQLSGAEVARVAALNGLSLQADGAFHLLDESGHTRFSLANYDNNPFQHHTLNQMRISGLTSLLDVPRVEQPAHCFDEMALLTRQVAMDLHAAVVDDHRVALGEASIAKIREQVAAIESRMLSGKITPGSAQARRLFS
jgi:FtsZ-interacting cell division protein ZipA